uniref:SFRICE_021965 n=1 Tax=Spodoptera frugiperda TaxID=7108 RepID=A0A2H1VK53_SPOFR
MLSLFLELGLFAFFRRHVQAWAQHGDEGKTRGRTGLKLLRYSSSICHRDLGRIGGTLTSRLVDHRWGPVGLMPNPELRTHRSGFTEAPAQKAGGELAVTDLDDFMLPVNGDDEQSPPPMDTQNTRGVTRALPVRKCCWEIGDWEDWEGGLGVQSRGALDYKWLGVRATPRAAVRMCRSAIATRHNAGLLQYRAALYY